MEDHLYEADIHFETDHLLSKWGFADGELLASFLRENGYTQLEIESDTWFHFARRVLCEVVERFVCMHVQNAIKPYRALTSHNPIRVYEVDGRHITDWEEPPVLQPLSVAVPKQLILKTAAALDADRQAHNGEIVTYMQRSPAATAVAREQGWDV